MLEWCVTNLSVKCVDEGGGVEEQRPVRQVEIFLTDGLKVVFGGGRLSYGSGA